MTSTVIDIGIGGSMARSTARARGRRTSPGVKPRFTREQVLRAALRLADIEGAEALTMNRLAEDLGVGVMTLYGYVRNKQELLDGIAMLAFEEIGPDMPAGMPWDERVAGTIRQIRSVLHRHPLAIDAIRAEGYPSPPVDRVRERLVAALLDAGFSAENALHATGLLAGFVTGFSMLRHASELSEIPTGARMTGAASDFPMLASLAHEYDKHLSDDAFEFGLRQIMHGLRAELEGQ